MKRRASTIVTALVVLPATLTVLCAWTWPRSNEGVLIAVGGGGTPPEVVTRAIELSGGEASIVAILPHASSREERGVGSREMFEQAGAGDVVVLTELASDETRRQLARATLVWMPGGNQNRLMDAVHAAELRDELLAMYARGVNFGGTSAGAAVQSRWMITGEAELEAVVAGGTELARGLGLWEDVIVDQHALKRRRFQRLLSAVLDRPERVGVGIDERTAVVLRDGRIEVLGASAVLVVDARKARIEPAEQGAVHAARGLSLHVLRAGMGLELD
jgi:cyanophycinase